jgi:cholesterol oxidase
MVAGAAVEVDVAIVGSGFGGSVAALRLAEKGYRVAVLEAGRRFADDEFPQTSWRLPRFLWAPALHWYGIQRITLLRNVLVLSGAGVGGGSLVYANTLYRPPAPFYTDPQWGHITDWADELAPWYDQAERMLGVTAYGRVTPSDEAMRRVAERMGAGHTHRPTPVGVYFGEPGGDPYFGGAGPDRNGCIHCGACMTGCRHNAKNSLVKNYLYLAERLGAEVRPLTTVTAIHPEDGGYAVHTRRTGGRRRQTLHARQVVLAAGALGTQRLLHRMRATGALPELSGRLGMLTRTNSEAILGARVTGTGADFTEGVAITSSFHPDPDTHIEPVRYGRGSNLMGLLETVLVDGGAWRPARWWRAFARRLPRNLRLMSVRHWSEQTVIALVMQSLDNSLTVRYERAWYGRRRLSSRPGHGAPNPRWIPAGHQAARLLAEEIGGVPGGSWLDVVNVPLTAHILGGATIGDSPASGVIDPYHRVYGHPGLSVVDGSAVPANLGVNPSLTITALAERAMSLWPNKGQPDPRPAPGEPYTRLDPVPPRSAAVPADAPAALRPGPARR